MKSKSPRKLSYAARLAASTKVTAARNAGIVKEIQTGTRTARELAGFYKVQVGTIRGIFARATGHPAPYEPSGAIRRSLAYVRKRARAIIAARKKGVTYQVLADRYGVTAQRVRAIYVDATRRDYEARLRKRRMSGQP